MQHRTLLNSFAKILYGLFCLNMQSYCQISEDNPYRIVLSSNLFQNVKPEDAEAATKILARELKKERNNQGDFEIVVCKTEKELIENLKKDFDLLYITPVEVLQLRKKIKIEPVLVTGIKNTYGDIYYLITNKKNNKKDIRDLKDGIIFVLAKVEGQTASLWLDKILRDNKIPRKEKFFKRVIYDYKATNVVLPVFFNKATATIITSTAFDLLCELNPQIKQDAELIQISKPLLNGIICFDGRSKNEKRKKYILDYMSKIHLGTYGKQIAELYMVDKLIPFKEEYLENFLNLYK